jgi:hypothetical protein
VFKSDAAKTLSDWSRDGKYLAYTSNNDVWALPLSGDPVAGDSKAGELKPIQVTKTTFVERLPRISPDSRWIAYVSNKSGQDEVYVQSFPEPGIEQQVSAGTVPGRGIGGVQLRWSRDGKQLFYFTANPARIMVVDIKPAGSSLNAAAPALLFRHPGSGGPGALSSTFSVTTDGRFLFAVTPGAATGPTTPGTLFSAANPAAALPITIIVNWAAGRKG